MTARIEPISGLSYGWALGEDNWNTGMDSNLVQLGATININVLGFATTPSVITNGTRYIVASGSGDFAGQDDKLAARVNGEWLFYTLPEGCIVYDESSDIHYKLVGGEYKTAFVGYENSPTFSAIATSNEKRLVAVDIDETNDNLPTLYFHDGTNLNWIPMVEA